MAGFFAFLMIFQAFEMSIDVVANELGKVKLASQYGEYYKQDSIDKDLNKGIDVPYVRETVSKEPVIYEEENPYEASQEVKSERTENSKT